MKVRYEDDPSLTAAYVAFLLSGEERGRIRRSLWADISPVDEESFKEYPQIHPNKWWSLPCPSAISVSRTLVEVERFLSGVRK